MALVSRWHLTISVVGMTNKYGVGPSYSNSYFSDKCLKWRVLPYSQNQIGRDVPDSWQCRDNPDQKHKRYVLSRLLLYTRQSEPQHLLFPRWGNRHSMHFWCALEPHSRGLHRPGIEPRPFLWHANGPPRVCGVVAAFRVVTPGIRRLGNKKKERWGFIFERSKLPLWKSSTRKVREDNERTLVASNKYAGPFFASSRHSFSFRRSEGLCTHYVTVLFLNPKNRVNKISLA